MRKQKGYADDGFLFFCGAILVIALICWIFYAIIQSEKEWTKFKNEHKCTVIGKMSGDVITTVGLNGKVGIGFTDDKTGYLCNDGVTYWR